MNQPTSIPTPLLIGVDLGGTKCAVSVAQGEQSDDVREVARFASGSPHAVLARIYDEVERILISTDIEKPCTSVQLSIGISCGGPLDAERGVILSPPNLPGWDSIAICEELTKRFGGRARLMNDANACALAEWRLGGG